MDVRVVATARSESSGSRVTSDDRVALAPTAGGRGGAFPLWTEPSTPRRPRGSRAVTIVIPPAADAEAWDDFVEARFGPAAPGMPRGMHETATLDYCVVLEGGVVLELADGSITTLEAGDVCVQQGAPHRWSNPADVPARVFVVLVD